MTRLVGNCTTSWMLLLLLCPKQVLSRRCSSFAPLIKIASSQRQRSGSQQQNSGCLFSSATPLHDTFDPDFSPWTNDGTAGNAPSPARKKKNTATRFRQHVNPLSRKFQHPTSLSPDWPKDVFLDLSLPLHLDIGCGKGGFLLDMAEASTEKNYLGLEIRPSVAQLAQERVFKRNNLTGRLCFVGCNANVDLERLLTLHQEASKACCGTLEMVSIQFPDPHFKTNHAKRRVVTPEFVTTLAKFMPNGAEVFLQSDIKSVLDDMRLRFRTEGEYFRDEIENVEEYMESNPLGIETERERSVLVKGLPVYRTMLRRTSMKVE